MLPLFPHLQLVAFDGNRVVIRNAGDTVIRTRTYGEPEYRLIAKGFDADEREVSDQWLALPRDLRPGDAAEIDVRIPKQAVTLRLYHAMQDIPMLEPEVWESARVR